MTKIERFPPLRSQEDLIREQRAGPRALTITIMGTAAFWCTVAAFIIW